MATEKKQIDSAPVEVSQRAEKPSRDRTLSDRAYENILSMIAEGRIAVGDKLPTEHALSEELEISRPVLRQALKQLRADGVIVSRQGSGSYVQRRPDSAMMNFAPVGSIADIQRTFEFRAAVEGEAAYLAAQRRGRSDLTRLNAAFEELERCVRTGELGVEADEEFHMAVCAASDNQYFMDARNSMKMNILTGMNLTRNLSLIKPQDRLILVQQEHRKILSAIERQDQNSARQAMRTHVDNARKRVFEGQNV